ncbi:MAG: zinc-binding dehydrogenase [Alphaproteobacteria bacterium]|nr:zinc-binding dehydrogenase [Alphaproteobacteria bacterium]
MRNLKSREIHLKSRPVGMPTPANFELAEVAVPEPKDGEVLVRNIWMSVDPYMRGRMMDRESYVPPFQIGQPLQGGAIGQVVAAGKGATFGVGDYLNHMLGWREYAVVGQAAMPQKVDPKLAPVQSFLGALGMPGLTAYVGLFKIGAFKDGETVFVSAASGAVGAVVCQLAKAHGAYVVGSAGSDEKCDWLVKEAKIDKAINYKKEKDLNAAVGAAFPKGIDVYFENVGGAHLEAAINHMRIHGRIAVCGMIEQYNNTTPAPGPANFIMVVPKSLRIEGFIVSNHFNELAKFHAEMGKLVAAGKMKWRESVVDGIENAPQAFLGLFKGDNFGKALVKVGPDKAV